MSSSISSLNAAQISQVANATSERQATKMNLLDRIIDWFKGGVQRDALLELYNKISDVKPKPEKGQSKIVDFYDEKNRMTIFAELRNFALPEHRDKFQFDVVGNGKGKFECKIRIAGVDIYNNPDIGGLPNSIAKFELMLGTYGMQLEDACRNDDKLFAVLAKIDGEMRDMASLVEARQAQGSTSVASEGQVQDMFSMGDDALATRSFTLQTWDRIQEAASLAIARAATASPDDEKKNSEEYPDLNSEEYPDLNSEEYLDLNSEEYLDLNSEEYLDLNSEDDIDLSIKDDSDSTGEGDTNPAQKTSEGARVAIRAVPRLEFALPEKAELATETMKMLIHPLSTDDQSMLLTKLRDKRDSSERSDSSITGEMPSFVASVLETLVTSLEHQLVSAGTEKQDEAQLMFGNACQKA